MMIEEVARAMLEEKSMPKFYWAEAVRTTVYLQNQICATRAQDLWPHELYFGRKPNLAHLRVFGNIAYVHVSNKKQKKLDAKAKKCIFIGYSHDQKGYKCYNPWTKHVRVSQDVMFDEPASWFSLLASPTLVDSVPNSEDEANEAGMIKKELRNQDRI